MKRLFADTEMEEYTEDGSKLDKEAFNAIAPIVKKYHDMGYSVRDIEYIISSCATIECLLLIV